VSKRKFVLLADGRGKLCLDHLEELFPKYVTGVQQRDVRQSLPKVDNQELPEVGENIKLKVRVLAFREVTFKQIFHRENFLLIGSALWPG
jgi:hypothetical protein